MFVFKSHVHSFHYLYQNAEYFHRLARASAKEFDGVRTSRTALLLYILSLEGLINRALEQFLPEPQRLRWKPLSWKHIPDGLSVKETDVIYRQTQIPRDPYAVRVEHVDTVKAAVDAIIAELDRLLDGRILAGDWYRSDGMGLIWPSGSTIEDLPNEGAV